MKRGAWIVVLVALLLAAGAIQLRAWSISSAALDAARMAAQPELPWNERIASARAAVGLRPDIVAYRQLEASLQAQRYAEIGALDKARETLIRAWGLDRENTELREQLRDVNAAITARDSRKAHVLHGREQEGGVLDPGDLMP